VSDAEAIAKRIVANNHRLEWASRQSEVTLPDIVEVAKAYLQQSSRDVGITGEWLQTFCRVDGQYYVYKHVMFRMRSDGTWDCWIVGTCGPNLHLNNQFLTRGDVYDLLNGMKVPVKGAT